MYLSKLSNLMDMHSSNIGIPCDLGSKNLLQPPKKCLKIIFPYKFLFCEKKLIHGMLNILGHKEWENVLYKYT